MTDAERVARARVDDAVDRLMRAVERGGVGSAGRERMLVGQTLDRLVRVTREAVASSSAERADD